MKNLPAIILFFSLSFTSLYAQQYPTLDSLQIHKVTLTIQHALQILSKNDDSTYTDAVTNMKLWLSEIQLTIGTVNTKGNLFQVRTPNSTKLVVLPDSSMNLFSSYDQSASLIFMPIFPADERYIYLRHSSINVFTEQELALQILHEMYHVYQYISQKDKYFAKNDMETIILKEAEAWKFESYLFLLVNPQYKRYVGQCDCRGDLLIQMGNFCQKNKIDYRIADYLFAYVCPKTWFKSLITQRK